MSKILLLCYRNQLNNVIDSRGISFLFHRIIPDNISPSQPLVVEQDGILLSVINPNSSLQIKNTGTCVGHLIGPGPEWWKPLSPIPDGAYALFRADKNTVELVTDIVASRTIWWVQTENMFIASTSQRAIVFLLRSFELNESAVTWMLASGCLGPGNSWDRRIKCLGPDARLVLDRRSWKITTEENEPHFGSSGLPERQYETELKDALEYSFAGLSLDYSKWALLLSGGGDSRAILLSLKDKKNLRCITWGKRSELANKVGDADIARQLAEHFGLIHQYYELDVSNEPLEKVFDRFIILGEGRTNSISGYLDGFAVWKSLFDSDIVGVIRGDQAFGRPAVTDEARARQLSGAWRLTDYGNLDAVGGLLNKRFPPQSWPTRLNRKDRESIAAWRDRLHQEFRIPVILAALTELKCAYVEVITPLLSRRIVQIARKLPDSQRTNKALWKKIIASDGPEIPFAKHASIPRLAEIFETREAVGLLSDTLNSRDFRELFSSKLIDHTLAKLHAGTGDQPVRRSSLTKKVKQLAPDRIKSLFKRNIARPRMNYNVFAFRIYLAGKAYKMFSEDADILRHLT